MLKWSTCPWKSHFFPQSSEPQTPPFGRCTGLSWNVGHQETAICMIVCIVYSIQMYTIYIYIVHIIYLILSLFVHFHIYSYIFNDEIALWGTKRSIKESHVWTIHFWGWAPDLSQLQLIGSFKNHQILIITVAPQISPFLFKGWVTEPMLKRKSSTKKPCGFLCHIFRLWFSNMLSCWVTNREFNKPTMVFGMPKGCGLRGYRAIEASMHWILFRWNRHVDSWALKESKEYNE